MIDIILNEVERAEQLLKNNETLDNVKFTLSLLARYDAQVLEWEADQIADHLRAFSEKNYREISLYYLENVISYYAGRASSPPLVHVDHVPITTAELTEIAKLSTIKSQCIAFSALALAKFETMKFPNVNFWIKGNRWGEIARRANVTISEKDLGYEFGRLKVMGMIEFPKRIDSCNLHVLFASPLEAEDIAMELRDEDFKDLGYALRAYWGESFVKCQECGRWIRQAKNGRRKFCDECASDNHRAADAAYRRRQRT